MKNSHQYTIKIITGQYQTAPSEQKKMVEYLFGENAEHKYEIYFHWYNLIHELGHAVMMFNAPSRPHPAEEEQLVNNFATAYWRHYGEQEKIDELYSLVHQTISRFTVPSGKNADYMEYAKEKWGQEELNNFNNYGWFQFSSVQNAILNPQSLEQAIYHMSSLKKVSPKRRTITYDVNDKMAFHVVGDAAEELKSLGILLPQSIEVVYCDDVNCHMCCAEKTDDDQDDNQQE